MIEQIALPGMGRLTTRIGFGGSGLMGGLSERESLRLLETAWDAGLRHFDVAPSYGHGQAERCMGKFLRNKREQATVTTKYGIVSPSQTSLRGMAQRVLRPVLRPVVRHFPDLRKRVAQAAAENKTKARFCAEDARRSLEHSLRELGVERIDLWLLHEATAEDLDGSDLLQLLQQSQGEQLICTYGIGGERSRIETVWLRHPEYCPVVQFEWSVLDASVPHAIFLGAFCIHHRVISGALPVLNAWFTQNDSLCRRWSDAVDANLFQQDVLAALLLQATLITDPQSMVLFSSRVPEHIHANLRRLGEPGWSMRARRFRELIDAEVRRSD